MKPYQNNFFTPNVALLAQWNASCKFVKNQSRNCQQTLNPVLFVSEVQLNELVACDIDKSIIIIIIITNK